MEESEMIREIKYNLPGYGFASCYLIGQAVDLLDLLDANGRVEKMQNTCQLGTMKYVYPGAHHTRYEYVFTQLMLISNIASSDKHRNIELSLSAYLAEYEEFDSKLSGSALMQCLAILSNVGHMYDTFTTSRILQRLLVESKNEKTDFYNTYRRNLPSNLRKKFDEFLENGNYYKLHLFHTIQIIQSMNRSEKNKPLCDLCVKIVSQLIDPSMVLNEATQRIFYLYKKIRKIAYLSVDMVYTPASFGANLSRMVYSISTYVDDLFDENSAMNKSISQLEEIIHQQIYDSAISILNSTRIEQGLFETYRGVVAKIRNVFQLREFLLEIDDYSTYHSKSQPKEIHNMIAGTTLLLSKNWSMNRGYDLSLDSKVIAQLPLSRIAFGTQLTQNFKKVYSAYGLVSMSNIHKDVQTIISNAIRLDLYDVADKIEFIKYAIKSLYSYEKYYFNVSSPNNMPLDECVFIGKGCSSVAQKIRTRFTREIVTDPDALHEIHSCATVLEKLAYSGTVLCFVGSIKASMFNKTDKIDELDGFIYLPNKDLSEGFAYIIEAKNYPKGEEDAEKQLEKTCKYIDDGLATSITKLTRCAYIKISKNP